MDSQKFTKLIVFLKKWIVPLCAGSIFVSVFTESYISLPKYFPFGLVVLSLVSLILFAWKRWYIFLVLTLVFLGLSLGVFRFHLEKEHRKDVIRSLSVSEEFKGEVIVVSPPDFREKSTKIIAKYNNARLLVTLPKDTTIQYLDTLILEGKLTKPEPFETDQGRIFDYSGYLAKDRVFFEIRYPQFQRVHEGSNKNIIRKLYVFKEYISHKIQRSHSFDEQGLLRGILLGERGGMAKHQDAFIKTGTIHIVALSGYNVTIISEAIAYALVPMIGVSLGLFFGALGVVLFAIMTGLGATIVRATVMGLLAYGARMTGREYDIGRALMVAGIVMVVFNPWILVYDVSFQLSFIATLGLLYCTPVISSRFGWIKNKGIKEIVSATIATNITVLPFVAYMMGMVSLVSIPANILIAPLVPLAMLFGTLSLVVFVVVPLLSIPLIKISSLILNLIIQIAEQGSKAPASFVTVPQFSIALVLMCYIVLGLIVIRHQEKDKEKK